MDFLAPPALLSLRQSRTAGVRLPALWFCRIVDEALDESSPKYLQVFNSLSTDEQQKIQRFVFIEDRQRAIVSILLQRALIHDTFSWQDLSHYDIRRTREVLNSLIISLTTELMDWWLACCGYRESLI
jgi:hypothetical protein